MKKISYKIILLVFLISLPLSISILIIARKSSENYINKETMTNLSLMPHFYTENIKKSIYASDNSIDLMEVILKGELDRLNSNPITQESKKIFLTNAEKNLNLLLNKMDDIYWVYFFILPEYIDLGEGVSLYKKENQIIREDTGDPKSYEEEDASFAWYFDPLRKGEVWTEPYEWKGETLISHVRPVKYRGKVVGIVGADIKFTKLKNDILNIKIGEKGYAYVLNNDLKLLIHPTLAGQNIKDKNEELAEKLKTQFIDTDKEKFITEYIGPENTKKIGVFYKLKPGYIIAFAPYYDEIFNSTNNITKQLLTVTLIVILAGITIAFIMGNLMSKPLMNFVKDFVKLSKGDLTVRSQVNTNDEIKILSHNFNIFISNLNKIITDIKGGADNVAELAQRSNHFNEELAVKSAIQASSLEETSTVLEEMSTVIQINTEKTVELSRSMMETGVKATKILEISDNLKKFIEEMNSNAKEIDNIIDVMNEISFQTNLLAINIAIEASRGSSENKGLMVISKEVRNLSKKSGLFSKEIKEIIKKDTNKRGEGTVLVSRTVKDLNSILEDIKKNNIAIQEISTGAEEQQKGIKQIEKSMADLDNITQGNLDISSETVNLSEKVYSESLKFLKTIKYFKQNNE